MNDIANNLEKVMERIATAAKRVGRDPAGVRLVAVSKTKPAELIEQAIEAGHRDFGENYVQEAIPKIEGLPSGDVRWHFIGHLQKNKARFIPGNFWMVHSVDNIELARQLDRRAGSAGLIQKVLVQVNISDEESKSGIDAAGVLNLLTQMADLGNTEVLGLMTMPPFLPSEEARPYFQALVRLRDEIAGEVPPKIGLDELSMGMTGDLEAAVEEGATIVRVGTAIFGGRGI